MVILVYDCDDVILTHTVPPTAGRRCSVLLFIFGTQPVASFDKDSAKLSAETTDHFAGQFSGALV
jgi:hypothetical protein